MMHSAIDFVHYENQLDIINSFAKQAPAEFVKQTELAYRRNIASIAARIAHSESTCKVIMLSGPSSSGKTTTAHMLAEAFRDFYIHSEIISLDDFYRGENQAPVLPNGEYDYESVEALNVPSIQKCLLDLMQGNSCEMPVFDFETHTPHPYTRRVELKERDIAIVEGIHALNPCITENLPNRNLLKVYISVKQGIDNQSNELFSANDMRLLRRIVRDSKFRNTLPERTIHMWHTVMQGEYKYIKPYRDDADVTINSLHVYEPCVLKEDALPLLESIGDTSTYYKQAQKFLCALQQFERIPQGLIPRNSMLREFIGGGIYS